MRIPAAVAAALALLLLVDGSALAEDRPILAVFDVETKRVTFKRDVLDGLADHLWTLMGKRGYQVVPRSQLKERLTAAKKQSYKECYDKNCQIEVGRELAADKTLATQIILLGKSCRVNLALFDLGKATSEKVGSASGPCDEASVVRSLEAAVLDMFDEAAAPPEVAPPAPGGLAPPEVEARLQQDQRKAAERRKTLAGPIGKGIEAWRKLLAGTLAQGPYLRTAQRRLAAVEEARRVALLGMARIPEGEFVMGCSPGDDLCFPQESPPHRVWVSEFWIDLTEVTVAAYQKCVQAGKCSAPGTDDLCNWKVAGREQHPLGCVDWSQARSYCAWAGKRLPSEAEWERAARAGSTGATYGPIDDVAWHRENSGDQPHPVGEKQPNAFGLYDMLGGVWEWCEDWYAEDYYKSSPALDPRGPATGKGRIVKGGAWNFVPSHARASNRGEEDPEVGNDWNGFRCASSAAPGP